MKVNLENFLTTGERRKRKKNGYAKTVKRLGDCTIYEMARYCKGFVVKDCKARCPFYDLCLRDKCPSDLSEEQLNQYIDMTRCGEENE